MTTDARTGSGAVEQFDADAGLGVLRAEDGTEVPFHCIAIADGSRTIATGTVVSFELIPKLGRYEAWNVRPA